MYNAIIKNQVKKSFKLVNERKFDELVKDMAPDIKHTFAGDHAMGGIRHNRTSVREWLGRLARLTPNLQITVQHINVEGWPHNTLAIVRWTAKATLENGEPYKNAGVHFITLKWFKVTELEVYEDSLAVGHALEKQYASGIKEAKAPQILS